MVDFSKYSNSGKYNIPDNIMELAYKGYAMQYGKDQSLETIKERGGFGIQEILNDISYYIKRTKKQRI